MKTRRGVGRTSVQAGGCASQRACWPYAVVVALVFWPWLPRYTDGLWAVDGPTAASWHVVLNSWLMWLAALLGIYRPLRWRRADRLTAFCWLLAAGMGASAYALHQSEQALGRVWTEQTERVLVAASVPAQSYPLNSPGSGEPLRYHVAKGVRWPLYYERLSDTEARVYTPHAFGRRLGVHISKQAGAQRLSAR